MKSCLTIIKTGIFAALLAVSTLAAAVVTPPTGVGVIPFGTNINSITAVTLTESVVAGNKSRLRYYTSSGAITCLAWTLTQTGVGGGRFIFKTSPAPSTNQLFMGVRGAIIATPTEYANAVTAATTAYGKAPTVHIAASAPTTNKITDSTTAQDKWSFISGTSVPTIEVALTYDPRLGTGTCSIRQYLP
jgi:hypothetical protein